MVNPATAWHEAAHAIAAIALGLDVHEIKADAVNPHVRTSTERTDFEGAVIGCAGPYAAYLKFGAKHHSAKPSQPDLMELRRLSDARQKQAMDLAWRIVNEHWPEIERVATALIKSTK